MMVFYFEVVDGEALGVLLSLDRLDDKVRPGAGDNGVADAQPTRLHKALLPNIERTRP